MSFFKRFRAKPRYHQIHDPSVGGSIIEASVHAASIWRKELQAVSPSSRASHFSVYCDNTQTLLIGYGIDNKNAPLNDFWKLKDNKWKQLQINSAPRIGAKAVLIDDKLYVFGGFLKPQYFDNFHSINLKNNQITLINIPNSKSPVGRVGHIMAEFRGEILVWGGFNGKILRDCWIYSTKTKQWRPIQNQSLFPISSCFCQKKNLLFAFGGSTLMSLVKFDFHTKEFTIVSEHGECPSRQLVGAGLIWVGRYLILLGGMRTDEQFCHVFAFDTQENKWYKVRVFPESNADGEFDINGNYKIPCFGHSSYFYDKNSQKIFVMFGEPKFEFPAVYSLDVRNLFASLMSTHSGETK